LCKKWSLVFSQKHKNFICTGSTYCDYGREGMSEEMKRNHQAIYLKYRRLGK